MISEYAKYVKKTFRYVVAPAVLGAAIILYFAENPSIKEIPIKSGILEKGATINKILEAEGIDTDHGTTPLRELKVNGASARYWLDALNPGLTNDYSHVNAGDTIRFPDLNANGVLDGPVIPLQDNYSK